MKNKFLKTALPLSAAILFAATMAGCGQSAGGPSASAADAGELSALTVSGDAGNSQAAPPREEEREDAAPSNTENENAPSAPLQEDDAGAAGINEGETERQNIAGASESDADTSSSETANPVSDEDQNTMAESGALSGVDLNVRFGDNGSSFALHLYDNETAAAIARHVGTADWRLPIYNYEGYDNWEVMQYYDIPARYEIPSAPQRVTEEKAGAVYYSEPNRIVLYFGDAQVSSEYTPVGYIDGSPEFVDAVKNNPVLEGWGNKIVNISN